MTVSVSLSDLLLALDWVSASVPFENAAFVNKATGEVHMLGGDVDLEDEEELPADIDDERAYAPVPHKKELDLGRELALQFVDEHLPDSYDAVQQMFQRRGAYSNFKRLLDDADQLDAWHAYEEAETKAALVQWGAENGFELVE